MRRGPHAGAVQDRGPLQAVALPPEVLDFLAQRLVLVEERLLNREIAMAMPADDRLILDLLGAERTKQVLAPRRPLLRHFEEDVGGSHMAVAVLHLNLEVMLSRRRFGDIHLDTAVFEMALQARREIDGRIFQINDPDRILVDLGAAETFE